MKQFGILFLVGYALSGGVADASTYYVSKAGSDSNSCAQAASLATPRLTVNAGIGCLSAGDTLLVRSGNYSEGISFVASGTSWANKVRIANYPGETVWLRPLTNAAGAGGTGRVIWLDANISYVEFDGISLDGTNLTGTECVFWASTNNGNNPHHIRLQNAEVIAGNIGGSAAICLGGHTKIGATGSNEIVRVTIHGGGLTGLCGYQCASYGIYVAGPNNLVDGCDIYDTSGAGVQIYNAAGDPADNNIIRNNRIHDITRTGSINEVWGVLVTGSTNQIYNNLIYGIKVGASNAGNAGIGVTKLGNKIWNNTIYNNTNSGIFLDSGAFNTEIRNNIAYASTGGNFVNGGNSTTQSNNLFGVDPLFVNRSANDLRLQAASPAVNAGAVVSSVTTDIAGLPRPQGPIMPDIGAYEFGAGTPGESGPPSAPAGLRILGAK